MSFEVRADVLVEAAPDTVFEVLVDVERWHEWSTWLEWQHGSMTVGERIGLRLNTPDGGFAFEPTVLVAAPGEHLAWVGRTGLPGVFDGEHHFVLEVEGEGTRLENRERYSGLLTPIMRRMPAMKNADEGFAAMNAEIKARAEALTRAR